MFGERDERTSSSITIFPPRLGPQVNGGGGSLQPAFLHQLLTNIFGSESFYSLPPTLLGGMNEDKMYFNSAYRLRLLYWSFHNAVGKKTVTEKDLRQR